MGVGVVMLESGGSGREGGRGDSFARLQFIIGLIWGFFFFPRYRDVWFGFIFCCSRGGGEIGYRHYVLDPTYSYPSRGFWGKRLVRSRLGIIAWVLDSGKDWCFVLVGSG